MLTAFQYTLTSLLWTPGLLVPVLQVLDCEIFALHQHVLQAEAHSQDLLVLEKGEHTDPCHCMGTLVSCA